MRTLTTTVKELKEKSYESKLNDNNIKDVLSTVIECFDYINSFLNHQYCENPTDATALPTGGSKIKLSTNSSNKIKLDREK